MKRPAIAMLLSALVGGGVASAAVVATSSNSRRSSSSTTTAASVAASSSTGTRREVSSTTLTATQVYQQDSHGIVSIKAVTADGEDSGTGIVLNEDGLIVTNDHVIEGARTLTVNPGDSSSETRTATIVGEEANSDLALIKIDPSGLDLKPLKLVSSSSLEVGDAVYAIGNPYGLEETLTRGIVSALGREISAPDGHKITGAIQTDAALNPGNSGGPLIDEQGDVIGINSQIASDAASVDGSQPGSTGVGFAIASNTVAEAVKKIEAGKGVSYEAAVAGRRSETEGGSTQTESSSGAETESPYGTETESPYGSASSPYESTSPEGDSPYGYSRRGEYGSEAGSEEGQQIVVP